MEDDTEKMAPTVSIETVVVVRPLKVVAVLLGFVSILLLILTIGASNWLGVDGVREGLWQVCTTTTPGRVHCLPTADRAWIMACRALCILSLITCFVGCVITCRGLQAGAFRTRYRCYFVAMLVYFLSVLFLVTALIIVPVKFSEEVEVRGGESWTFGWTYGVGWGSAVFLLGSALLLCLDKDTDEIIFREKTSYNNSAIEEVSS